MPLNSTRARNVTFSYSEVLRVHMDGRRVNPRQTVST